jgi:hypothetical protein
MKGVCEIWNPLSLDENIGVLSYEFNILIFMIGLSEPTFYSGLSNGEGIKGSL